MDNKLILWVALAALLIAVLNLPPAVTQRVRSALREAFAPIQSTATDTARGVKDSAASLRGYKRLVAENQQMAAELTRLHAEVRDLKTLREDNDRLREQLRFVSTSARTLIPCEVIGRDQTGWWQTIRLNKGSADGVEAELAVITTDGLVGKTIAVSEHTADVLLISDPGCRVSARIQRTKTFGVLSGRGPSWKGQVVCRLEFINKNVPIIAGDEVVTSGMGGIFPKGLLIGYVERVFTDRSGLYQHAEVISKADVGVLQSVFVIRETTRAASAPGKEGVP